MLDRLKPRAWKWTTIAFGVLCASLGTIATNWWNTKAPRLVYTTVDALPFPHEKGSTGIYQVIFKNDGNKEAEKVVSVVKIPNANITDKRIESPPSLDQPPVIKVDGEMLRLDIARLDPDDQIKISVLARSDTTLEPTPEVDMRSVGVKGVKSDRIASTKVTTAEVIVGLLNLSVIIAGAILGIVMVVETIMDKIKRRKTSSPTPSPEAGSPPSS